LSRRFYFRGIQAKTLFIFLFVFIIIIAPVNLVIYNKVKGILTIADASELRFEAEKLFSLTRLDPQSIPLPSSGYSLKVQLNNNMLFQDIFTSPDFPELEPFQYFIDETEADTFKIVTLRKPSLTSSQLLFSLARSNQRLENQLIDLRYYLFAANAASILIAGLVVFIATGITLQPIRKIIQVTNRINASKSIERVPVPKSKDENKLLAETINAMLARMEQTIQNQTNFFASAAHELKTPLAVIQTELSIALQSETNQKVIKILQSNLTEAQRLDRVIQDFLLISQLRSESLILRKRQIELDEVFYSALKKIKYMMQERGNSVQVKRSEEPFWILADYDKLETVISNLLENAMKYSPERSVVTVSIHKENDLIHFAITNPVSKSIENPGQLKEEFRKSEELSSGLGMGLWICDKIIAMHGAELTLKQVGTTFTAEIIFKQPDE
jgi:two-component system, OmpR family, heavy metal sensor histidine kinase CusS